MVIPSHTFSGFVEKEIKKANIPIADTGENPEVPFPRDMIDLEVKTSGITGLMESYITLAVCFKRNRLV